MKLAQKYHLFYGEAINQLFHLNIKLKLHELFLVLIEFIRELIYSINLLIMLQVINGGQIKVGLSGGQINRIIGKIRFDHDLLQIFQM